MQDVMLRGWTNAGWEIIALAGIAAIVLVATWLLIRRATDRN